MCIICVTSREILSAVCHIQDEVSVDYSRIEPSAESAAAPRGSSHCVAIVDLLSELESTHRVQTSFTWSPS